VFQGHGRGLEAAVCGLLVLAEGCGGTIGHAAANEEPAADAGSDAQVADAGPVIDPVDAQDLAYACEGDWIVPDTNGSVSAASNLSGITGTWALHSDCDDLVQATPEGEPPMPGVDCSLVTAPPPGAPFSVDPATNAVCTRGTTVQATLQHEGWHRVLFSDLAQIVPTGAPLDLTRVMSVEVEVPASRLEAIPWDFRLDGLVALR